MIFRAAPRVSVPQDQGPVVVKFSGGRSSGMLLAGLLDGGQLRAERGDVVIFNNTSAEHPVTYDFVAKMGLACQRAGVPMVSAVFTTYEDPEDDYYRCDTYRLEHCRDAAGMVSDGSAYKDMIARGRMIPTHFRRICTHHLKVRTTERFLGDWWTAPRKSYPSLGHVSPSKADFRRTYDRYRNGPGGRYSEAEFRVYFDWLARRPAFRLQSCPAVMGGVPVPAEFPGGLGGRRWRQHAWINVMGLRADEPRRIARMRAANDACRNGEVLVAPLAEGGITRRDVLRWWERQADEHRPLFPVDCDISNCVYCFLKGDRQLLELVQRQQAWEATLPEPWRSECDKWGPHTVEWWQDLEREFGRGGVPESERNVDVVLLRRTGRATYQQIVDAAASHTAGSLDLDGPGISCFSCTD